MKISLSIRDDLAERMRAIAAAAGVSSSSVAEVALKRLFASGDTKEIVMLLDQDGARTRRYTRKTWLEAFYAAMRHHVPAKLRNGGSGYEFMRYDVLPAAERSSDPNRIVVHTMEANLPTTGASTYDGMMFPATLDSSPIELAKQVVSWLRTRQ
jgi:hypothetical protein